MAIKLNGNIFSSLKINGNNIVQARINGNDIFLGGSVSNEIKLIYSNYNLVLQAPVGTYELYYANSDGILTDYDKIIEMSISIGSTTYNGFNNLNVAPTTATSIVVINNNNIVASLPLPNDLKFEESDLLYSVGLLSDIHIDGDSDDTANSVTDLTNVLNLFQEKNVDFICVCGDVTESNRDEDYTAFENAISNYTIPLKVLAGNHDSYSKLEEITGCSLYYEYEVNNDIYLFIGSYIYDLSNPFTDEELNWLEEKLASYTNKRVFLFQHYYCYPVGDAGELANDGLTSEGQALRFRTLLNTYKSNLIFFSGHSHLIYELQTLFKNANVSLETDDMCKRVHIPSLARPRKPSADGLLNEYEGSLGAIMDVYSDYIVYKGYDFTINKIKPVAIYKIPFQI